MGATTVKALARADVSAVPMKTGGEEPTGKTVQIDATEAVRQWAGGVPNHGALLRMPHVQYPAGNLNVYSRDAKDPALRPKLIIKYEPAP